jgi:hypothetical protein
MAEPVFSVETVSSQMNSSQQTLPETSLTIHDNLTRQTDGVESCVLNEISGAVVLVPIVT